MSLAGTYRIDDTVFPAPPSTVWEEQPIETGLNGIPVNASYRLHRWEFGDLESSLAKQLFSLHASQQSGNAQLSELETDPYDASLAIERYGTEVYTDFVIQSVSARTRGLPNYSGVTVIFEVYVS